MIIISTFQIFGQCPDRNSLWNRLVFIRDSSNSSATDQLKELVSYEKLMESCPDKIDSTHAFLLKSIGSAYFYLGEYLKTLEYFQKAISMISTNANLSSINVRQNIEYYYSLATVLGVLNKTSEKFNAIDNCIELAIKTNSIDILCLSALYKKIEYLFYVGDYHSCIEYCGMCESLATGYGKNGKSEYEISNGYILTCLGWQITAFLEIKKYETAEEILTKKIGDLKNEKNDKYIGTYLEKLAEVEVHKGNFEQALINFNQAFTSERKAGHTVACKGILNNIGYYIYLNHYHDYKKTLYYYKKALDFQSGNSQLAIDPLEALNDLANIASVYSQMGIFDSANVYFQHAFDQIKPGLTESALLNNPDEFMQNKKNHYLIDVLINKGDAYIRQYTDTKNPGNVSQALIVYKIADQVLDRIKDDLTEVESKLFWRANSLRLYEHAIEASYLINSHEDAFYFFEKSRSVLLNDQLNQLGRISSNEIMKLAEVKKRILSLERERISADSIFKRKEENRTLLFESRQELSRLEQTILQNSPLYFHSFLDTTFVTLPEVRKILLNDHQGLLEVFNGDSAVYSIFVVKNNTYLNKINKTDFDSTSRRFVSYISDEKLINSNFFEYTNTAHHLYKLIFQNRVIPEGRIVISPDGQYFPFEALVTDDTKPGSPVYFLRDHAVSYTYSSRYLMNDFEINAKTSGGSFLGLAPVKFPASFSLSDLQGSERSLYQIGTYFNDARNFVAADASKNNFQKQFSNYQVIQLYTHASEASIRSEPVIYFADSALYLSDLIPENRPQTRLIVLSACETGNGKLYQGEGVFSFNRGFASLGIPSSVTNLWAVDNISTYRITELFYRQLSSGLPIDVALQKAKLEFIEHATKENKLPYYWAATILAGKSDQIVLNRNHPWIDILIILGLIGVFVFFWQRWGVKNNQFLPGPD